MTSGCITSNPCIIAKLAACLRKVICAVSRSQRPPAERRDRRRWAVQWGGSVSRGRLWYLARLQVLAPDVVGDETGIELAQPAEETIKFRPQIVLVHFP